MPQKHLEHYLLTASAKVDNNTVTMDADGESANAIVPLTVVNTRGFNLPQTGGHGTWMYGVAGTVLMVAAAIILGKRPQKEDWGNNPAHGRGGKQASPSHTYELFVLKKSYSL